MRMDGPNVERMGGAEMVFIFFFYILIFNFLVKKKKVKKNVVMVGQGLKLLG